MSTQTIRKKNTSVRLLWLPMLLAGVLGVFCLLPRAQANRTLQLSIGLAVTALVVYAGLLRRQVLASGRTLKVEVLVKRVHWVQLIMHTSVYTYWDGIGVRSFTISH